MTKDVDVLHRKLWRKGAISISADEAKWMNDVVRDCSPKTALEVGTAMGLSSVVLANAMAGCGGKTLDTVDLNKQFTGDKALETGYLIEEFSDEYKPVTVTKHLGNTTFDLRSLFGNKKFDLVFIDANHQHPFPTIDMMLVLPFVKKGGIVMHHDLRLYQKQNDARGIGPKYLFDQVSDLYRSSIGRGDNNIFYIKNEMGKEEWEDIFVNSLYMPWSAKYSFSADVLFKTALWIESEYKSEKLKNAFINATTRYYNMY